MLVLKNIKKDYVSGDEVVHALKGIDLNFRQNEFVSILGQSGCGKTTLLNIIGGLDQYTQGDLIINGKSTKDFKDRDWATYRNHSIGFIFQSYNLISHQSVLSNVELALTLSGVSKEERRKRAIEALEKVGLADQLHKKPNQMSGGQMQRVAIARALVNNPEILLADEPTGALDTTTSVQIMDLLKEIAKDRLVIMVTHNPELAQTYSTRIIQLRDGLIIDDSMPYETQTVVRQTVDKVKKTSMSFFTALSLSLNNLMTKKARTALTAFAGSIGIIGIALILSLSQGTQDYIDRIQEETLSSYPLTITSETADMTSALLSMVSENDEDLSGTEVVKENQFIASMFTEIGSNDLNSFMDYVEENKEEVNQSVSLIQNKYTVTPLIYDTKYQKLNPSDFMSQMMGGSSASSLTTVLSSSGGGVFNEMLDDEQLIHSQYDVLKGRWPEAYNETVIVLTEPNGITDMLVYGLGLRDTDELTSMIRKIMDGEKVEEKNKPLELTYDALLDIELKLVNPSDLYRYNDKYDIYEDMSNDESYLQDVVNNSIDLKIVGIVCLKDGVNSGSLMNGLAYSKELTEYIIDTASKSEIVQKQLANKNIDVFSGNGFDEEKESELSFEDMISIDTEMLSDAFGMDINEEDMTNMTQGYMTTISSAITTDITKAQEAFTTTLSSLMTNILTTYYQENQDPLTKIAIIKLEDINTIVENGLKSEKNQALLQGLENAYVIPKDTYVEIYKPLISGVLQGYISMTGQTSAMINEQIIGAVVTQVVSTPTITDSAKQIASKMTEAVMQKTILSEVGALTQNLIGTISSAFNVDSDKIASAFSFDLSDEEVSRLMSAMSSTGTTQNAATNLLALGYQDLEEPTSVSFYFKDFESKDMFLELLNGYNDKMEAEGQDDKVISYTDITGLLMSSVKSVIDAISYILIAFVSISLVVSSIMIGIITYISVLERTKEIGILRSIGASKKDISRVFNAETFIVGLISGMLGIFVTVSLNIPINSLVQNLTDIYPIAVLPTVAAMVLVLLSLLLTTIAGLIPSRIASKKDPVEALRTE